MVNKRTFDWEGVEYQSPEYYRLWRKHNSDKSRAYHREYDRQMYKKHPEREHARRKRWADSNKDKIKAHKLVSKAIKAGKLFKQPCETCGAVKVIAHHADYSKPLDVMWLCELHHKQWHRDNQVIKSFPQE